ncbi:diaminopimelate epimerase [archaeon]|nr:diaminopimelate epimerase [archaeon]
MKFTKMHGLGNDYIYVNCFKEKIENPNELSIKISDRHFGVGSDGLVLIEPSKTHDFKMRIFNPDGSEAEMCGNATRCVAKYVYDNNMTKKTEFEIETKAGTIKPKLNLNLENNQVKNICVDMGEPILERNKIPMIGPKGNVINENLPINNINNNTNNENNVKITCVSMGNPHCIIFIDNTKFNEFETLGKTIENHKTFPNRTNVEFVEIINNNEVNMRVWERGAGETLACGTGACATTVACILNNKTNRKIIVHLKGGDLEINWDKDTNHVFMTGPAEKIFDGTWKN